MIATSIVLVSILLLSLLLLLLGLFFWLLLLLFDPFHLGFGDDLHRRFLLGFRFGFLWHLATDDFIWQAFLQTIEIEGLKGDEEENAEAVYVTRSYVTRHGNGPLPYEEKRAYFYDETNMPNEWQGTLRFARDPGKEEGLEQVRRDVSENSFKGRVEIFVTHLNEVGTNSYGSRYESYSRYAEEVIVKSDAV